MYKEKPVKIRRVLLQAFETPNQPVINGRFYFPDVPELNNTTIVGVEFIPGFTKYLSRYNYETNVDGGGINANYIDGQNFTITFTNEKKEYILENFPVNALFNSLNTIAKNPKLVLPFNFKTILRNCFVTVQDYNVSLLNLYLNFNFYYLD